MRRLGIYFVLLAAAIGLWWLLREPPAADTRRAIVPRERPAPTAAPAANAPSLPPTSSPPGAGAAPSRPATPAAVPIAASAPVGVVVAAAPEAMPASTRPRIEAPPVAFEEVRADLARVRNSLRDFRTIYGENPVGTNAEIMRALNGENSRQARLAPEGMSLNGNGELVDQWGTPIFFHQLSKDQMEIISAGPDRIMGTNDDILVR